MEPWITDKRGSSCQRLSERESSVFCLKGSVGGLGGEGKDSCVMTAFK